MPGPPPNQWFKMGAQDAEVSMYPLYATLIAADLFGAARQYAAGWEQVTGAKLSLWYDRSADLPTA